MRPGSTQHQGRSRGRLPTQERPASAAAGHSSAALVEAANDAIVSGDLDTTIRTWNTGAERLFGYTAAEMIGRSFLRLVPVEDLPRSRELRANLAEGGAPVPEIDTIAIRKGGRRIPVSLSIAPLADAGGRLTGAVVVGRDISRRREAAARRREAEQRFAGAFDNAPIGFAIVALDGRFLAANRSLCDFLGRDAGELVGMSFQELTHPDDLETDLGMVADLAAGRIPRYELEKRYLRADGVAVWGRLSVSLVRDENDRPDHFVSQVMDIDASKQHEFDLQQLTGHLRGLAAIDGAPSDPYPCDFDFELDRALERAGGSLERAADLELSGVAALVAALEARDHYTAEHSRRVVELAGAVARRLGLDEETAATVERVAVLHDVGKVAVPDSVLQKRGSLSDSEWELMRQHPAVGARIVASTRTLAHLAPPIRAEHEHWDGGGYPDGLRGEQIPIESRITLACDAYQAMTSARPYRGPMSDSEAQAELRANAGAQFDPGVVEALLAELTETAGKLPA